MSVVSKLNVSKLNVSKLNVSKLNTSTDRGSNFRHTFAEIDLDALEFNFKQVKKMVGNVNIMTVIKADAYGHGLLTIANSLMDMGADAFAVACVDEGIALRKYFKQKKIIILEGYSSKCELDALVDNSLTPVINNFFQLDLLSEKLAEKLLGSVNRNNPVNTNNPVNSNNQRKEPIDVWLKIDTGMHRLGFHIEQLTNVYTIIKSLSSAVNIYGLMSHFANADEYSKKEINQQQQADFTKAVASYKQAFKESYCNLSMANSAAIMSIAESHYDWVRPGIMLYGVNPFFHIDSNNKNTTSDKTSLALKAVMTLKSTIIAINHLRKGDCIGYGGVWCCPEDMPIAVVAIGYGDGYPRHAVSGTPVLVNGVRTQLVGRVSMDMITIDLRPVIANNKQLKIGDIVTLWGNDLAIEEVAYYCKTIAYELLCGISNRVKYKSIKGSA